MDGATDHVTLSDPIARALPSVLVVSTPPCLAYMSALVSSLAVGSRPLSEGQDEE